MKFAKTTANNKTFEFTQKSGYSPIVFKSKGIVAQNTDDLFFMESITDQLFASDFFL